MVALHLIQLTLLQTEVQVAVVLVGPAHLREVTVQPIRETTVVMQVTGRLAVEVV